MNNRTSLSNVLSETNCTQTLLTTTRYPTTRIWSWQFIFVLLTLPFFCTDFFLFYFPTHIQKPFQIFRKETNLIDLRKKINWTIGKIRTQDLSIVSLVCLFARQKSIVFTNKLNDCISDNHTFLWITNVSKTKEHIYISIERT